MLNFLLEPKKKKKWKPILVGHLIVEHEIFIKMEEIVELIKKNWKF